MRPTPTTIAACAPRGPAGAGKSTRWPAGMLTVCGVLLSAALATQAAAQTPGATQTPATSSTRPPSITVAKIATSEIVASIIVAGTIVAREEVLVVAEVDGLSIIELTVDEGDRVAAGQVLARLNRSALDVSLTQNSAQLQRVSATMAQARAQIAEAEANRVQATNALQRAQALREGGNTSLDILDQRVAAARGAEARLNVAREMLASAQAELANTQAQRAEIELRIQRSDIKAPRAGIVSRRNARVGAIAGMGAAEPLFRIIAEGAVELEAEIPEADIPRLKVGASVQVTAPGVTRPIAGQVRLISPEVDRQTRLGRARIAMPDAAAQSVGAFARGVIELDRRTGLTAPNSAISYRRDTTFVQIVEANTVRTRPVKLGIVGDGRVEIVEGVKAGDLVVARAGTFVRDGDIISPLLPGVN